MDSSQPREKNLWGKAFLTLIGLCVMSYLLTWPMWHPSEPKQGQADPAQGLPREEPVLAVVYETSEIILPATLASGALGIVEEKGAGKPCLMYAGNRAAVIRPAAEDAMAMVIYKDVADEPEECEPYRVFKITQTRLDHLIAGSKIRLELERERRKAIEEEDREQEMRDRLGLPP